MTKISSMFLVFVFHFVATSAVSLDESTSDDPNNQAKTVRTFLTRLVQIKNLHHREKRRNKGDTYSDLKAKERARQYIEFFAKQFNDNVTDSGLFRLLNRKKRYQYDEDYDWENGGLNYEDRFQPKREETKFEKWAKNWQQNALKFIFLFSFVMMVLCCCCACLKKVCEKTKNSICFHLREWRDICLCRDPTYRRMRHLADEYGFELDYAMYTEIKNNYEKGMENAGHGKRDLSGRA